MTCTGSRRSGTRRSEAEPPAGFARRHLPEGDGDEMAVYKRITNRMRAASRPSGSGWLVPGEVRARSSCSIPKLVIGYSVACYIFPIIAAVDHLPAIQRERDRGARH